MLRLATSSTSRSLRSAVTSSCSWCQQQQRSAHKLVEVELIKDVLGVGVVGDRLPLSPGFVRNRLLPGGQALLIVKGNVASPLRDMMRRERIVAVARAKANPQRNAALSAVAAKKKPVAAKVEDPLEVIRQAETLLAEALSLLPLLSFYRRLITPSLPPSPAVSTTSSSSSSFSASAIPSATPSAASAFLGSTSEKTITGSAIFGSVGERDVLASMREFGVTLEEGLGAFEDAMVEKGRIKAVGKFTFVVKLRNIGQSIPVQVEVREER